MSLPRSVLGSAGTPAPVIPAEAGIQGSEPSRRRTRTTQQILSRSLVGAIRLYQAFSAVRPPRCRFLPTCSAYALEAIRIHGARRGCWYAARRLLKCHPLGPHGVDPVPPRRGEPVTTEGAA